MYNKFIQEVNKIKNVKLDLERELRELEQKQSLLVNNIKFNNNDIDEEYNKLDSKIKLTKKRLDMMSNQVALNENIKNEINSRKDLKDLAIKIIDENKKKIDILQVSYDTKKREIEIMKAKYLKLIYEMGNIKREAEEPTSEIQEVKRNINDKVYFAGLNTYIINLDRIDNYFGITQDEVYKKYNNKEI